MGNKTRSKDVEREFANHCTDRTDEEFERVPQSGAAATNKDLENHVFEGDVFNEGSWNDVCIEVKKRENMKASHVFKPTKELRDCIQQAKDESSGKHVMALKINYQGWLLYMPTPPEDNMPSHNFHFIFEDDYDNRHTTLVDDGRGNTYKLFYLGKL